MNDPKEITFTKHAMQRARERKLWKYVSKEKFFYDAEYFGNEKAKLGECIYAFRINKQRVYITTMMHI